MAGILGGAQPPGLLGGAAPSSAGLLGGGYALPWPEPIYAYDRNAPILPPNPVAAKSPQLTEGPQEYTGAVLPFRRDIGGNLHWAVPGIVQSAIGGLTAPGDAYAGRLDPMSNEGIARATDLAGLLTLGGGATAPVRDPNALGIFGGRLAKTADLDALREAEAMAVQGMDRAAIWSKTGWFRGVDGQWRFEIPDDATRWAVAPGEWAAEGANGRMMAPSIGEGFKKALDKSVPPGAPMRVRNLLEHNPLEEAYPPVANTKLLLKRTGRGSTYTLGDGTPAIGLNEYLFPDEVKSVLLHELQHRVQAIENTAPGGSPINLWNHSDKSIRDAVYKEWDRLLRQMSFEEYAATEGMRHLPQSEIKKSYAQYVKRLKASRADMYSMVNKAAQETAAENVYRRLAGEVEARNVQSRMGMPPEARLATPPWETQDVTDAEQIVLSGRGG